MLLVVVVSARPSKCDNVFRQNRERSAVCMWVEKGDQRRYNWRVLANTRTRTGVTERPFHGVEAAQRLAVSLILISTTTLPSIRRDGSLFSSHVRHFRPVWDRLYFNSVGWDTNSCTELWTGWRSNRYCKIHFLDFLQLLQGYI